MYSKSYIPIFYFSSFICKEFEKHNPLEAIVIVKEELGSIDIDDIGNLEDLLRIVFIHEKCENLKVSLTVESLLKILTKRRSQAFYKLINVHSVINVIPLRTTSSL